MNTKSLFIMALIGLSFNLFSCGGGGGTGGTIDTEDGMYTITYEATNSDKPDCKTMSIGYTDPETYLSAHRNNQLGSVDVSGYVQWGEESWTESWDLELQAKDTIRLNFVVGQYDCPWTECTAFTSKIIVNGSTVASGNCGSISYTIKK